MQDQSAEAILKYVLDSGINAIELIGDPAENFAGRPQNSIDKGRFSELRGKKGNGKISEDEKLELADIQQQVKAYKSENAKWRKTADMKKFSEFRKMYNDAGVDIYAFKPKDAFGIHNSDADIAWGMKAAKLLGASHVTVEHPSDDTHTARLGAFAKKQGVYVGYHGHLQQTPTLWDTALRQSDYNALNLDLGHYVAAGNPEPLAIVRAKYEHIKSIHLKDRQTPEHDMGNLVWGSGDTPIKKALQLMRDRNYKFPATIELEYDIPEGSNAVEEVKKCLKFCREALNG